MYAALRENTIEYSIFEGINGIYPAWFYLQVLPNIYEDEYRYSHYDNLTLDQFLDYQYYMGELPSELVEDVDVFLYNRLGNVMRVHIDDFNNNYEQISPRIAALTEDVLEYFIYCGPNTLFPEWFLRSSEYRILMDSGNIWLFVDDRPNQPLDEAVFLKNKFDDIKVIPLKDFDTLFISRG